MSLKIPVRRGMVVHRLWLVEHFQATQMEASSVKVLSCARPEETAARASIPRSAACEQSCLVCHPPFLPSASPGAAAEQKLKSLSVCANVCGLSNQLPLIPVQEKQQMIPATC